VDVIYLALIVLFFSLCLGMVRLFENIKA